MSTITGGDTPTVPQNTTLYINNLNEKINLNELKKSLRTVFSQYGNILEVLTFKTLKHKGQASVVFEDVSKASEALKQMQGFPFYDKPMRIQYVKTKSDILAKADGTFVPRERWKRHDDKSERKRHEQQPDANQAGAGLNYAGAYGVAPPYPGFKEVRMVEAKPGIAFVEYGDEIQATVSMQGLQGFKITAQNPMLISYAK